MKLGKVDPKTIKPAVAKRKTGSPLYNFLLLRNGGRKPSSGFSGNGLPVFGMPPAQEPVVQPFILPNSPDSINARREGMKMSELYNREVRFFFPFLLCFLVRNR